MNFGKLMDNIAAKHPELSFSEQAKIALEAKALHDLNNGIEDDKEPWEKQHIEHEHWGIY